MEHLNIKQTIGLYARVALATVALLPLQFTYSARRIIGERDSWTCQNSGETFASGTMLHAAHYPEFHNAHEDNDPAHGRMLSVREHLLEHIRMFIESPSPFTSKALRLISGLALNQGYHTWKYYSQHPEERMRDRDRVIQDLADSGIMIGHEVSP